MRINLFGPEHAMAGLTRAEVIALGVRQPQWVTPA